MPATSSGPEMMAAAVATAYGAPEALHYTRVPTPEPGEGEALVRVRAASINPLDWKVLRGDLRVVTGPLKPPRILGADFSGDIVALGPEAPAAGGGLAVGDAVAGMTGGLNGKGAYAEYVTVPVRQLARKPEAVSYEQAGALGVVGLTALQGVRDRAGVRSGHRVLVNGASGGVGHVALQLAKRAGAHVTAVASAEAEPFVRDLGADAFIDYRQRDFARASDAYDVIVDAVGNRNYWAVRRALRPDGRYVTTTPFPVHFLWQLLTALLPPAFAGQRAYVLGIRPDGRPLAELLRLMASGELSIAVGETFELSEVAGAMRHAKEGGVRGKVVIVPEASDRAGSEG